MYGRFLGASRNHARLTSYLSAYFRNRRAVTVAAVTKHEEAGSGVTTTDTGVTTEKSRNSPQHKGSVTTADGVTTAESVTTSLLTWLGPELLGVTDVTDGVTDDVTALGVLRRVAVTTLVDGLEQVTGRN